LEYIHYFSYYEEQGLKGFKKENKKAEIVKVYYEGQVVFMGEMSELPLRDSVILQKSDEFFNDPTPCFIHRSAVRLRLLAELEEAVKKQDMSMWKLYAELPGADWIE